VREERFWRWRAGSGEMVALFELFQQGQHEKARSCNSFCPGSQLIVRNQYCRV